MHRQNQHKESSFALERADFELGGTGLLTCGLLLGDCAFPPVSGQWLYAVVNRPLTVAGQWRLFTALPEHLASELPLHIHYASEITSSYPWVDPLSELHGEEQRTSNR
jgi:hypothetical protein